MCMWGTCTQNAHPSGSTKGRVFLHTVRLDQVCRRSLHGTWFQPEADVATLRLAKSHEGWVSTEENSCLDILPSQLAVMPWEVYSESWYYFTGSSTMTYCCVSPNCMALGNPINLKFYSLIHPILSSVLALWCHERKVVSSTVTWIYSIWHPKLESGG